jgi:hypothetical protein
VTHPLEAVVVVVVVVVVVLAVLLLLLPLLMQPLLSLPLLVPLSLLPFLLSLVMVTRLRLSRPIPMLSWRLIVMIHTLSPLMINLTLVIPKLTMVT